MVLGETIGSFTWKYLYHTVHVSIHLTSMYKYIRLVVQLVGLSYFKWSSLKGVPPDCLQRN